MNQHPSILNRRAFTALLAGSAATAALEKTAMAAPKKRKIKLGFDNFSVRSFGWKAPKLLEYAASLKVDVMMFSDLDVFDSHDEAYLNQLKKQAAGLDLEIHAGTGGICPTSSRFNDKWGTAEEHLALAIRVANAVGSPVARCYLGHGGDRKGDGGIYRHIESTARVCKAARSQAVDAGVKIAIENHAGDMQGWELAMLIEEAGSDYVGATLDSGNATWTLEDPIVNLKHLGKYAASSGMRDSAIWRSENGAKVDWTNMGDGDVDWNAYMDLWEKLCPDTPFILEIISQIGAREYAYLNEEFWEPYQRVPAHEFARFVAMAEKGKPFVGPADRPSGERSNDLTQAQHKYDLESSLNYCKETLGIGLKD